MDVPVRWEGGSAPRGSARESGWEAQSEWKVRSARDRASLARDTRSASSAVSGAESVPSIAAASACACGSMGSALLCALVGRGGWGGEREAAACGGGRRG